MNHGSLVPWHKSSCSDDSFFLPGLPSHPSKVSMKPIAKISHFPSEPNCWKKTGDFQLGHICLKEVEEFSYVETNSLCEIRDFYVDLPNSLPGVMIDGSSFGGNDFQVTNVSFRFSSRWGSKNIGHRKKYKFRHWLVTPLKFDSQSPWKVTIRKAN